MKTINESPNTVAIMVRFVKNQSNLLKINVKKDFDRTIEVGDLVYSHMIQDKMYFYEIKKVVERRQSSLKQYDYMTFEAELVTQTKK